MRPAAQKEQKCKEEYERIISKTLSNMKTCCKMAMVGMRMFHSNGKENHVPNYSDLASDCVCNILHQYTTNTTTFLFTLILHLHTTKRLRICSHIPT